MKLLAATVASLALMASSAQAEETKAMPKSTLTRDDVRMVAPALDKYTQDRLLGDVWKRPGLAPRDRSIATLAVLIARNQTIEMPYHFNLALENGVKPREISEIITLRLGERNVCDCGRERCLCRAQDRGRSARTGFRAAASARRGLRGGPRSACRRPVRRCVSGHRPIHDGRSVPRPLAAPGPRAA